MEEERGRVEGEDKEEGDRRRERLDTQLKSIGRHDATGGERRRRAGRQRVSEEKTERWGREESEKEKRGRGGERERRGREGRGEQRWREGRREMSGRERRGRRRDEREIVRDKKEDKRETDE